MESQYARERRYSWDDNLDGAYILVGHVMLECINRADELGPVVRLVVILDVRYNIECGQDMLSIF